MKFCKIFGHKFRPRYSIQFPHELRSLRGGTVSQIEAFKNKTYHYDICERCGEIIKGVSK